MILIRHASLASTDAGTTLPCRVVFSTLLDVFFFFFFRAMLMRPSGFVVSKLGG